ncbi:unnamed protein product [Kuraishia capsulata CBS 1993]|uniref:Uncharacterized protein n=1 Tax=Kuraishia capsulata CBS 1993 TaxID=1382522 RepID=W6MIK7_9ASCO|nr:uncharacterized protein KUCA_T00002280001 [Kuraishia capsulata CBS 1993]CDK26309.1 unnamed protein product [Kuraishia capsulata CBS 1993]
MSCVIGMRIQIRLDNYLFFQKFWEFCESYESRAQTNLDFSTVTAASKCCWWSFFSVYEYKIPALVRKLGCFMSLEPLFYPRKHATKNFSIWMCPLFRQETALQDTKRPRVVRL